jgi:hypothetical protein
VFFGLFCSLVLDAAKAAAVLGLLRRGPQENMEYEAIWKSVKTYTWTLVRLSILIGLIAMLLAIPFALVMRIVGPSKFIILFLTTFYFFLVKYALADPLVVMENMNAVNALKRSWEMTKGHFWYVLGCYLFLWLGGWLITWAILLPVDAPDSSMGWAWLPVHLGARFIDSSWLILSWCMYLRIKEAEAQLSVDAFPNQSAAPEPAP